LPRVQIENSGGVTGNVVLELLTEAAPNTCANFLRYVDDQFYDGIVWHRVVSGFVIQGGAYERKDGTLEERAGVRDPIASEANNGESNVRGTVAMALRGQDADSATNQFFINLVDNTNLDTGPPPFTVFARVVEGLDVVDQIGAVAVGTDAGSGLEDVPVEDIVMAGVHRIAGDTTTDGEPPADTGSNGTLNVTASSAKSLVVNGQTAQLNAAPDDPALTATAEYAWEVVSGQAALSDPALADPVVTINTNGTVHLRVTVTDRQGGSVNSGTADVYVVGVDSPAPRVAIENSGGVAGTIVLELLTEAAPQTCANFLRYVDDSYFDGVVWHRVVAGFVIQGGAYERRNGELVAREGVRDPVPSEADNGESNVRGTVAMALRGQDAGPAPTSSSSIWATIPVWIPDRRRLQCSPASSKGWTWSIRSVRLR
jgi:peptidyl-prolyl cis-trans isomerase A (cyclophilin A)